MIFIERKNKYIKKNLNENSTKNYEQLRWIMVSAKN